jgi:hypothetical protein
MNYPAVVFWVLIVWSITARPSTLLVLLLASIPFASLALLPPEYVSGMSILPQSMFAVVLVVKVLAPQAVPLSTKLSNALRLGNLGFLALFLLVGTVTTVIMPRLFMGDVAVFPMRLVWGAEPLTPSPSNITQLGYVALSVMVTFAVMLMADTPRFVETMLTGLLVGGAVCILTGLIDIAAAATGMESLLEPFRNASYALLTDAGAAGLRRVVGFTPEASAYGPICVEFLTAIALLRHLYPEGGQRILATIIAVALAVMAVLSTSSTAYGGLGVAALACMANWIRRAVSPSSFGQRGLVLELLVGCGLAVVLLGIIIFHANLLDPLSELIDEVVYQKALSSSYFERSLWNSTAWDAVAATWGLGIGFGSTRTSNWFMAIISNSGLIGSAFMGIFFLLTFVRRPIWRSPMSLELVAALKLSLLPALVMAGVSAAGPDFGQWTAVILGALTGIAVVHPKSSFLGRGTTEMTMPARARQVRAIGNRAIGPIAPLVPRQDGEPDRPAPRPSF